MKILNHLFFHILFLISISKSATLSSSFVDAISDVIEVFFVRQNISFDIITFGKITSDIADVISEIGRQQDKKLIFLLDIRHVRYIELSDLTFNQSSIIIANK
ncbi:hypothetical protein ACKWTF_016516 [Chironomus riparius]